MSVGKSEKDEFRKVNPYEEWVKSEGIPVITGYHIEDLKTVPLKPWRRKGGLGAFINLRGAEQTADAYLCEVPPGGSLKPQRHLFEELIFVLAGRGATTIWNEGSSSKQTFEWHEGSVFSPPLNVWHQHFNGQGDKPARYVGVTSAPLVIKLFHNTDFIFNLNYVFKDRYKGEEDYFRRGHLYPGRIWESNFISDVRSFGLLERKERGSGNIGMLLDLSDNTMGAHISEFPVGTYKKAHRHAAGAHIIIQSGKGYSLMWPESKPKNRINWHKDSMFVPPERWFHQHFNTGREPARYLALKASGSQKYAGLGREWRVAESVKAGGDQIEYEDEEPEVRRMYEEELAKEGLEVQMLPAKGNK